MIESEKNLTSYPPLVDSKGRGSAAGIISLAIVWLVAGFTLLGAFILFKAGDDFEGWVGLTSLLFFLFFQIVLPKLAGMSNPVIMRNIISFVMVSSLTVGRYFYLYSRLKYFDKSQHILYGMVIVLIGLLFFYRFIPVKQRENPSVSPVILWFWLTGFAMLALLLWETFEFCGDRLVGSDMQSWKAGPISGLTDTMIDLLTGFGGAALMASLITAGFRRSSAKFYRRWLSGCYCGASAGRTEAADVAWRPPVAFYLLYIALALLINTLTARVWQPFYMVKSAIRIILFAFIPIFVSRYYTRDLSWLKIRLKDVGVRKACLHLAIIGFAVIALVLALSKPLGALFGVEQIMDEIKSRTRAPELMIWAGILYIPIFNASIEEIFFRGFIFRSLAERISVRLASLLSAMIFAVYHLAAFRNWFDLPLLILALAGLTAAGLFLNWLVRKYDSLLPAWLFHGLMNITIFAIAAPYI